MRYPTAMARSRILLVLLLVSLLSGACGDGDRRFLAIGTGGTGGVFYPYGGGLAEIWTKHVPGVRVVAEVTGASVENVRLAHRGETVIGEIMGDVAHQAYHGEGSFAGDPQDILALAVMYPSAYHVVALENSGIAGLDDLRGRTVSTGAPGSGTAHMTDLVLDALGIPEDGFTARRLSFTETGNALRDGSIDAGVWCVAPRTSSIMDLATTHDIRIVAFQPEEQRAVTRRYAFYMAYELEGGVYRGVDEPVPTVGVWNVIICKADLPDELVHDLAQVLFEQNEYMQRIHAFARYTTPENTVAHTPIPLHPGSIRCLEELGHDVPDALVPDR